MLGTTVSPKGVKATNANQKLQISLEEAILAYQAALESGNGKQVSKAYEQVCAIYPPLNFVRVWFKKYRYLYETREDFIQDYLRLFCTSLAAWKPRHLRGDSRYGGSGAYKNYFWGCLKHNYDNLVKADNAGKRSLSSPCPICDKWCNPLSTHLLHHHQELLWDHMESFGMSVDTLEKCPFCTSHRVPKSATCEHQASGSCDTCRRRVEVDALKRHLLALHSAYLFEHFNKLYPSHTTLSPRPTSVYGTFDDEEESNLYDLMPDQDRMSQLLAYDLTPVQQIMMESALNGSASLEYKADLYKCSKEEFNKELDTLQTLMSMCGMGNAQEEYGDE